MEKTDYLIIGAGISGLLAAEKLSQAGYKVIVIEKGNSVGGRMATYQIESGKADHGAQFFTVRSPIFQAHVANWLDQKLIYQWATGWSNEPNQAAKIDGYPRYAGTNGITAVPQALASKLNIKLNCELNQLSIQENQWHAVTENNHVVLAKGLLLTPPVPQSLALLKKSSIRLADPDQSALERISYTPCLAGLFWIEGQVNLPEPGAIQRPAHPFNWLANNQRKGISPNAQIITVHANVEKSWALWRQPHKKKVAGLLEGLRPFLTKSHIIKEAKVHQWRYARPTILHPERTLIAQNVPPLAFAGDAFKEARIEGASLSGLAAAAALLQQGLN